MTSRMILAMLLFPSIPLLGCQMDSRTQVLATTNSQVLQRAISSRTWANRSGPVAEGEGDRAYLSNTVIARTSWPVPRRATARL